MPKFAANLTTMFSELEPKNRFSAAARAGFKAVEFLRPYDFLKRDVKSWLDENELQFLLLNTCSGEGDADRGFGTLPGRESEFRKSFDLALEYVTYLGGQFIHVTAGRVPSGIALEACEETFIRNLMAVAPVAESEGITLLLEPLNTVDVPGYLHTKTDHTRRLIASAGAANIALQYDFYHMQIMQGALALNLERNLDIIRHVQFSSVPGRHEPQYGEVNLTFLFTHLDQVGYDGWVGCEYGPKGDSWEGLSWALPYGLNVER